MKLHLPAINRGFLIIVLILGFTQMSIGQILTFEFSALGGSEATASSNSNDSDIGSSTISRGSGLTASDNGGRFNATSWALTSIANAVSGNDYMEFTITPNSGFQFSVSSIYVQLQRSNTGPRGIALRNAADGYASNLDQEYSITDNTSTQNFTFTFTQSNSSSAVTYRIYGWAESTSGSGGIGDGSGNDLVVYGAVSATGESPDPEPTNHVTSFTVAKDGTNGHSAIDLSWTANDGAQVPVGYVIKASTADNISDPVDGTAISDNSTIGSDSGAKNITHGTNTYEWTGLTGEQTYYFKIYPYTNSGVNIDYKTVATVPNGSATTDATPPEPNVGDLYISEVVGDDADAGADNGFIEIYNSTENTINLTNVTLRYYNSNPGAVTETFVLSGAIASGAYLTATQNNTNFNSHYGKDADFISIGDFFLNGGDDGLDLYHSSNGILDEFNDNGTGHSPWTWDDANVFERTSLSDGAVYTNWTEVTSGTGSPGTANDNSLPVELSIWKATSTQGFVKLLWTTDSEIENQGFLIERALRTSTPLSVTAQGSKSDWKEIASFATNPALLGQGSTSSQNDYSFIDKQVKVGKTYSYRLSDVDYRGNVTQHDEISVTVKDAGNDLKPSDVSLHEAFPNPFNPDVNLSFTLENEASALSLEVYDIQGALVNTLSSGYHNIGTHDFNWDGSDSHGNAVSSGVYMVRLSANSVVQIQRVTLLR